MPDTHVDSLGQTAVIVVGSVNVDTVITVPQLPAAGETVLAEGAMTSPGGKGANQAVVAAALGARTIFVGSVGDDPDGRRARADLESAGVDVRWLTTTSQATGRAIVLVGPDGENSIAVLPGANGGVGPEQVATALGSISTAAVVVASLEVPLAAVEEAARIAGERGWTFLLNPAPACPLPDRLVTRCDLITPNSTELEALGGPEKILASGARAVVVTRGSEGAEVFGPGMEPVPVPASPAAVVDTTGAGDAFTAGLAVAVARGDGLHQAVQWAVKVAAIATEGPGARGSIPTAALVTTRR